MKKLLVIGCVLLMTGLFYSFTDSPVSSETLREIYSKPPDQWPAPDIDSDITGFQEIGILPASPLEPYKDSLKNMIDLGKMLFFDPRLSSSNQISCSSCHHPSLSWTDGLITAVGHDHQENKRNTPSLLNVWFFKNLFWDGRVCMLEDQAFSPINSEIEMNMEMSLLPAKLDKVAGYRPLFDSAFGTPEVDVDRITEALAVFQRTIVSRKSDFDRFLEGNKQAMSDGAIRGMHLFRTKARCINCHNGPLFSDNQFHNIGLTYYKRKYEDLGRYAVTQNPEDVGKFRTPSLRDVMRTRPWMHNGLFDNMEGIINMYNSGMPQRPLTEEQQQDPLFPKTSAHIKKLNLTKEDRSDLVEFLESITAAPLRVRMPELPQ